jgi:hypothetical protein
MENDSKFDNFENQLTQTAVSFLKESAKWCKFLAILGFVGIGLMLLAGIFMMVGMGAATSAFEQFGSGLGAGLFGFIYFLFAAVYFMPVYYLYNYATKTQTALATKNNKLLTEGLENLKSHHKFLGIFALIVVSIYALIFVFAIIMALFGR